MDHCTIEIEEGVALLTVSRPEALNALNNATLEELLTAIARIASHGHVRALVITGAGDRAFIAGADIKEMSKKSGDEVEAFCLLGQKLTLAMEEAPFPIIGAVNGYALGGGLEIALACDFCYGCESAKLGMPEVTLGLIPGFGGTQRLQRAVGLSRAKEMIYTGQMISAATAQEIGLLNGLYSGREELINAVIKSAKRIAALPAPAVRQAKMAIVAGERMAVHEGLAFERTLFKAAFMTQEAQKGLEDFLEKRAAR